jgi:hypothetical protein
VSALHTPGPWIVNPFRAQVDSQRLVDGSDLLPVCQLLWPTDHRSEDETQANAYLIAAAPELLEALERILSDEDVALSRPDYVSAHAALRARAAQEETQ